MMKFEKVTAYKVGNALETNPKRAFAWLLHEESNREISFTGALWIVEHVGDVHRILEDYIYEKTIEENS